MPPYRGVIKYMDCMSTYHQYTNLRSIYSIIRVYFPAVIRLPVMGLDSEWVGNEPSWKSYWLFFAKKERGREA